MNYDEIVQNDQDYFMPVYGKRFPVCLDHGTGCRVTDINGKTYLDFVAGIATNCLGYAHPGFNQHMKAQLDKMTHCSNLYYNQPQAELIKKLCGLAGSDYRCFLANSGAEANETAIKLVRKHFHEQGKYAVLSLRNSFHGRTMATLSATGQEKFHTKFTPLCPEFDYFSSIEELKKKITPKTGGVMLEMVQGEGGVNPMGKPFIQNIAQVCKENGLLLIVDEIQTGMGRCGTLFAFQQYGIQPDIFTLAKALGNGIPISACLAKSEIHFDPGEHGTTFGGNPFACAAANYVVDTLDEQMLAHIREMSDYLKEQLNPLSPRGLGLLVGFTIKDIQNKDFVLKCLNHGLLLATAGFNTVRLVPPLMVTKTEIDQCVNIIFEVIKEFEVNQ